MPPKKGGKGKGKSQGVVIDGVNTSEMTREQIEIFALRLKEELERERDKRNFFQLERDKLRTYWEITRNELQDKIAEIRAKNTERQVDGEKHDDEIKRFRQTIKNLRYDHELNLAHYRTEAMIDLRDEFKQHYIQEDILEADKRQLKNELIKRQEMCTERTQKLRLHQQNEVTATRTNFNEKLEKIEENFNDTLEDLQEGLNFQYGVTLREMEDRFDKHLVNIKDISEKKLTNFKFFYNHVIQNNFGVIDALKKQINKLSVEHNRMKNKLEETLLDNASTLEPLKIAEAEARRLRACLKHCEKDFRALKNTQKQWKNSQAEYDQLKINMIALKIQHDNVTAENRRLYKKMNNAVLNAHLSANLQQLILDCRNQQLKHKYELESATDNTKKTLANRSSSENIPLHAKYDYSYMSIATGSLPVIVERNTVRLDEEKLL